jgi:hypothetical protein
MASWQMIAAIPSWWHSKVGRKKYMSSVCKSEAHMAREKCHFSSQCVLGMVFI